MTCGRIVALVTGSVRTKARADEVRSAVAPHLSDAASVERLHFIEHIVQARHIHGPLPPELPWRHVHGGHIQPLWSRSMPLDPLKRDPPPDAPQDPLDLLVEATAGPQPGRRLFHAANGLVIWTVLRFSGIDTGAAVVVLGVLCAIALAGDLARLRDPRLNRLFFRMFSHFASPRERQGVASSTWYLAGIVAALVLFPRPFAEAGVLVLALADPAASWFGRRYGKQRFGTGSLLGSAIFWLVATGVLWPLAGAGPAVAAGTVGALAEALPWRVDDNVSVPLATAAALTLSSAVLG